MNFNVIKSWYTTSPSSTNKKSQKNCFWDEELSCFLILYFSSFTIINKMRTLSILSSETDFQIWFFVSNFLFRIFGLSNAMSSFVFKRTQKFFFVDSTYWVVFDIYWYFYQIYVTMVKRCCLNFDKIFKKYRLGSLLLSTAASLEPATSQKLNSFIGIF